MNNPKTLRLLPIIAGGGTKTLLYKPLYQVLKLPSNYITKKDKTDGHTSNFDVTPIQNDAHQGTVNIPTYRNVK